LRNAPDQAGKAGITRPGMEFREIADSVPVMIWVTEPGGACTYLNRRWFEYTGQSVEEALGTGWLDAIHPDDKERSGQIFLSANARREPFRLEYRLRRADGSYGSAIDAASPRFSADGTFLGFAGTVLDVSASKKAEEELALSDERLHLATELSDVGFWYVDVVRGELFWPPRVKAMFGISPEAPATLQHFFEGLHPEDRERTAMAYEAACDPQRRALYDVEHRTIGREDGVIRWVAATGRGIFDATGRCVRVLGTATDITARKNSEKKLHELNGLLEQSVTKCAAELHQTQRRFRAIFDSALEFMALLTPGGTVVEVNRTALDWARIPPEAVIGTPFWDAPAMRGDPGLRQRIEAGIRQAAAGETVREQHEVRGPDGVQLYLDFSLKPVRDEDGRPVWLVAEGRDITELKRTQDALRQAQKLEAIGQLTGGLAHDFNNLLTIIRSSTDLLRNADLDESRRRRYIDAIADTVDLASKLTSQLLAFARRQALKPEKFDPALRIRAIGEMLCSLVGSRVEVVTDFECARCFVEADPSQFEAAIMNIALNARDAMEGRGQLKFKVSEANGIPAIRGHPSREGHFIAIEISDTGAGIPDEHIDTIFEPFFTTKEVGRGTGLGLSQVHGFVNQSGGNIEVRSEVGRGTAFRLYLPRTDAPEISDTTRERKPFAAPEHGLSKRVLIVEDNEDVGSFATRLLEDLGYEPKWAKSAEQALDMLDEGAAFDVIFSDVVMPGMGGIELARRLRDRHPELPVVLTSGYSNVLAEEGRHGFELLHKPYAAEELSKVLWRATMAGKNGACRPH
jgi:PAS domain S-box-containing protein